ncbi:hypothetical protein FSARC_6810 [Fusarium sarcochroum]|uniref:Uncharacterized protein n=1 Tax=Fusarium sarcochroum TaxID=1208366 RepID=A0A8H4TWQ3_9HYPO|nr:hypothetical protein FSARC_6810 [Fusarium sarcochroum]
MSPGTKRSRSGLPNPNPLDLAALWGAYTLESPYMRTEWPHLSNKNHYHFEMTIALGRDWPRKRTWSLSGGERSILWGRSRVIINRGWIKFLGGGKIEGSIGCDDITFTGMEDPHQGKQERTARGLKHE